MMASPEPPTEPLFKCGLRLLGERQRGGPMVAGVLHLLEGSGLWERFLRRFVNDEHREGMQTPIFL